MALPVFLALLLAIAATSISAHKSSPAMIWSDSSCSGLGQRRVDYQVIAADALAGTVHDEFSKIREQCSDPGLFVEFIGNELLSSDLSRENSISDTVNILKSFIADANHSLVLPYVTSHDDGSIMVNRLLDGLNDASPAVYGCPGATLQSSLDVEEFIASRKSAKEPAYLVVCSGATTVALHSEGQLLKEVLSIVKDAGIPYAALYASDPYYGLHAPHRLLATVNGTNTTSNSTNTTTPYCDEVCQTKATLLEAILVSVVLLVILISGLCCMMGIQTPLRFEKPHDS